MLQASGPTRSISVVVAHIVTSPALSFDIEPWPPVIGMPLRPIQAARWTSRRAASISVATSASVCWMRCVCEQRRAAFGAAVEVLEGPLVGGLGDAERRGADQRPGHLEGRQRVGAERDFWPERPRSQLLLQLLLAAEQVLDRDPAVLEHDLGGVRGADPELASPSCPG